MLLSNARKLKIYWTQIYREIGNRFYKWTSFSKVLQFVIFHTQTKSPRGTAIFQFTEVFTKMRWLSYNLLRLLTINLITVEEGTSIYKDRVCKSDTKKYWLEEYKSEKTNWQCKQWNLLGITMIRLIRLSRYISKVEWTHFKNFSTEIIRENMQMRLRSQSLKEYTLMELQRLKSKERPRKSSWDTSWRTTQLKRVNQAEMIKFWCNMLKILILLEFGVKDIWLMGGMAMCLKN